MSGNTITKLYGFSPFRWDRSTKIVIENSYFGPNQIFKSGEQSGIYNLLEMDCSLADGSKFNNNIFDREASSHNFINLYQVDDGTEEKHTTIEIKNNVFNGRSDPPIRIGFKGDPQFVDLYIEGNKYVSEEGDDPGWTGLFIIQPYDLDTLNFSGLSIYLKDNDVGNDRLFYYYEGNSDNVRHLIDLDETMLPKVYLWDKDGYKRISVLDYLDPSTAQTFLAPLLNVTPETPSGDSTEGGDTEGQ